MLKVLVAGGAGYVGSVLVRALLNSGYGVSVLDCLYYGIQGIEDIESDIELFPKDIRDADPSMFEGVHAVVNLAGLSNDPTAEFNPELNKELNTDAAIELATSARDAGVRRYVLASTCSIYDVGTATEAEDVLSYEDDMLPWPKAPYSRSKFAAERGILALAGSTFCPTILRKGTICGVSPRMRYDLVVNTLVKDAILTGVINLHCGGEMWRPLIDVQDVARAYIACILAPEERVNGQIFNVSTRNMRISELALRIREVLKEFGLDVELRSDYRYSGMRSYRVSAEKIASVLGFTPQRTVEESARQIVEQILNHDPSAIQLDDPVFYNIRWMTAFEEQKNDGLRDSN